MPDSVVAPARAALKRTILQSCDIPDSPSESVLARAELGPNQLSDRHAHPGPEAAYVLEGSGSILIEGRLPIVLKAGESYQLAARVPHAVQSGPQGFTAVVTWVKPKGEPLTLPMD